MVESLIPLGLFIITFLYFIVAKIHKLEVRFFSSLFSQRVEMDTFQFIKDHDFQMYLN